MEFVTPINLRTHGFMKIKLKYAKHMILCFDDRFKTRVLISGISN